MGVYPTVPVNRGWRIDIVYRIAGYEGFIHPDHPAWNRPLPSIKKPLPDSPSPPDITAVTTTHGDYFQAVQRYFQGDGQGHILKAVAARYPSHAAGLRAERMEIILEKHGEFYHPARLLIPLGDMALSLVLNVAVTPVGAAWMASEVEALSRVSKRLPSNSVPAVYGQAMVPGAGDAVFSMFLADWFEGFHEFHLSIEAPIDRQRIVVWDTSAAPFFLSGRQQAYVYRRVAFLLTRAYDPHTTEQIYPWHHASGDFVLRTSGDSLDLRLVTVRQYAPTIGNGKASLAPEDRLTALLVFFLNLTVRNRIDRLDGTGRVAWADAPAVIETVKGFFTALDETQSEEFAHFLKCYRQTELMELLTLVADRYCLMPMEKGLLRANLASHGGQLYKTLEGWLNAH